jgi:hypothetical protein
MLGTACDHAAHSHPLTCCCVQGADAACCTSGQPTYKGKEVNFVGLPTCSDGPCSGRGFDYRGAGASESPNPESCCDTEGGSPFMYNPPATEKGALWPPVAQFPSKWPGTGRQCNTEAPRYRCSLGGEVGGAADPAAAAATACVLDSDITTANS